MTNTKCVKALDTAVSRIVREAFPLCQRCGKARSSQCAHIFTRGKKSVRFDPRNLLAFCYYCHIVWAHRQPAEFMEWVETRMGRMAFLRLRADATTPRIWERKELEDLLGAAKLGYDMYRKTYKQMTSPHKE